jgi:hypothetical protein
VGPARARAILDVGVRRVLDSAEVRLTSHDFAAIRAVPLDSMSHNAPDLLQRRGLVEDGRSMLEVAGGRA